MKNHNYFLLSLFVWIAFGGTSLAQTKDGQQNSIKQNAMIEAKVMASFMRKKYKTDEATEKSLVNVYYEQRLAISNMIANYSKSADLEVRLTSLFAKNDSVNQIYERALKTKSIFGNKTIRPDDQSRFALAVRYRELLKLDSSQVHKLFIEANRAYFMAEKENFNLRTFERKELPLVLSDVQYVSLLKIANHKQALGWATEDWKEMKSRGLAEGLDSGKVTHDIYQYDLATLVVREKYGESIPANHSLKAFETPMPESLSKLKAARRYNNPIPEKSSNAKFSW